MEVAAAADDDHHHQVRIRSYNEEIDRAQVEELERRCEVGPSKHIFLFTDTLGDPICRIRNSPIYKMLVAETTTTTNKVEVELVGVIQGTIKFAVVPKPPKKDTPIKEEVAKMGYILGLRVSPLHRRKGIGSRLVYGLEQWFIANQVDYSYMATERDNEASVNLFVNKFGFVKFRTPAILVNPVSRRYHRPLLHILPSKAKKKIEITKIKIEQAEFMYKKFMGSAEFFPHDIDKILRNKLSLGTWVAYYPNNNNNPRGGGGGGGGGEFTNNWRIPPPLSSSWAMVSVWNSGDVFKLRLGQAPMSCMVFSKSSRMIEKWLPCLKIPSIILPDFFNPFGFYFMYGVHKEGPLSGKLVRTLCHFVNNMARTETRDCKVIVTEVGGNEEQLRLDIPHWKLLSCPEDLWCIKALKKKNNQEGERTNTLHELTKTPPTRPLFVDPRDV